MVIASSKSAEVIEILDRFPRCRFASLPTPLDPLPKLSDELGINLFVKRDDLTGLAMGGNKVRKLEFLIADVVAQGCDCVITWAGMQSNWCRQLAAAARDQGIKPILVLFRRPARPAGNDGNVLLDLVYGADVRIVDLGDRNMMEYEGIREVVEPLILEQEGIGHKPYVVPIGGSAIACSMQKPLGALGYVEGMRELLSQAKGCGITVDSVVLPSGSGGMQAGLLAGTKLLTDRPPRVVGISVGDDAASMRQWVTDIARRTMREFACAAPGVELSSDEVIVFDDYIREGYGLLDQTTAETLCRVAQLEGLLLDPVYTAKAMSGLIDMARRGYFKRGESVVFLHTGGLPALFAYRDAMLTQIEAAFIAKR